MAPSSCPAIWPRLISRSVLLCWILVPARSCGRVRCPGVSIEDGIKFTDPARHELDMVFHFEQVGIDQGATKWDVLPLDLPALKASLG